MNRTESLARIFAEEAGFDVCELNGKPEVCIPSDNIDYGLLQHLSKFYELVKAQVLAEANGTDDPLLRAGK